MAGVGSVPPGGNSNFGAGQPGTFVDSNGGAQPGTLTGGTSGGGGGGKDITQAWENNTRGFRDRLTGMAGWIDEESLDLPLVNGETVLDALGGESAMSQASAALAKNHPDKANDLPTLAMAMMLMKEGASPATAAYLAGGYGNKITASGMAKKRPSDFADGFDNLVNWFGGASGTTSGTTGPTASNGPGQLVSPTSGQLQSPPTMEDAANEVSEVLNFQPVYANLDMSKLLDRLGRDLPSGYPAYMSPDDLKKLTDVPNDPGVVTTTGGYGNLPPGATAINGFNVKIPPGSIIVLGISGMDSRTHWVPLDAAHVSQVLAQGKGSASDLLTTFPLDVTSTPASGNDVAFDIAQLYALKWLTYQYDAKVPSTPSGVGDLTGQTTVTG